MKRDAKIATTLLVIGLVALAGFAVGSVSPGAATPSVAEGLGLFWRLVFGFTTLAGLGGLIIMALDQWNSN